MIIKSLAIPSDFQISRSIFSRMIRKTSTYVNLVWTLQCDVRFIKSILKSETEFHTWVINNSDKTFAIHTFFQNNLQLDNLPMEVCSHWWFHWAKYSVHWSQILNCFPHSNELNLVARLSIMHRSVNILNRTDFILRTDNLKFDKNNIVFVLINNLKITKRIAHSEQNMGVHLSAVEVSRKQRWYEIYSKINMRQSLMP